MATKGAASVTVLVIITGTLGIVVGTAVHTDHKPKSVPSATTSPSASASPKGK